MRDFPVKMRGVLIFGFFELIVLNGRILIYKIRLCEVDHDCVNVPAFAIGYNIPRTSASHKCNCIVSWYVNCLIAVHCCGHQ